MLHMSLGSDAFDTRILTEEQPVILVTTLVVKLWVMALQMLVCLLTFNSVSTLCVCVCVFKCLKNPSRKTKRSYKHMHFKCLNV